MNKKFFQAALLVISSLVVLRSRSILADDDTQPAGSLPPAATKTVDFVPDIQPIFQRSCERCHGNEKQKSEYRLDVRDIALTKGESYAPSIVIGKNAESPLIQFGAIIIDRWS